MNPTAEDRPGSPWPVLVVDDEPAIHEITGMLLERMAFEGRPIELHHASSAVEARERLAARPDMALVILDVVMETDDAGLRLCRYIRETLGNREIQIVLRTGQPGQAPEREVILGYEINGYFVKTELTAQRLQSLVVCALRAWCNIRQTASLPGQGKRRASGLAEAIRSDALGYRLAPIVGLSRGQLLGIELQAQWTPGPGETLAGTDLEALAEAEGLAAPLGRRLIGEACREAVALGGAAGHGLRVSVNVPAAALAEDSLTEGVREQLKAWDLAPSALALEVAEPGLLRNLRAASTAIAELRRLRVAVIADQFGTGSCSVAQLRHLDLHGLKVASRFIEGLDRDADCAAITRSVIALAHTQSMTALAEGVNSANQWEFLRWEGCDAAQGSFPGEPMTAEQAAEWFRRPPTGHRH
ncbi:EAL domain-containing response regulator [Spiribacter halobius]|uniref:Diguanylate phosphodiesterase n=1 Tax=Sediminicurvatus halobius TaxID=2182432 RepID=A0A2U2MXR9_9GAMM|nr:EAL domain-containing protein [Spiribacter halobius]PWG61618.1 hypothetical protein DEM34_15640 [Spiribacter halobius]UEX77294.1 EAL domain-containing protein [Spiribacter halobius]